MNFPKLGASQLSLGITAGAQALAREPTDPGVPRGSNWSCQAPGPGRLHAEGPAGNGFRPGYPGPGAPSPLLNDGSLPALLTQTKEGKWALQREDDKRPVGFSRYTGRPQLNFPDFSSGLGPLPRAPRPSRPPPARSAEPGEGGAELCALEPPPGARALVAQVAGVVPPTLPQPTWTRSASAQQPPPGSPPGSGIRPGGAGS